jgi:hypothetical protein
MTDQWLERIEKILWPDGPRQNVWMIVDGARSIDVFRFLLECYLEYSCLYSGPLTPDLEMAAPYLVQLDHGYRDTHRLIRKAWCCGCCRWAGSAPSSALSSSASTAA